ncbi:MAG: OmpA family protein, partial [Bacteroidota bacterium]
VEPERTYSLEVSASGYDVVVDSFTTPTQNNEDVTLERNLFVRKLELPTVADKEEKLEIQHIYFDFDKAGLREEAKQELDLVAEVLQKNPEMNVEIRGHTDWYGTYDYNVALSEDRTGAAYDYLVSLGLPKDRVRENHFSENRPIEDNENDRGRQFNRRCEFLFVNGNGNSVFGSVRLRTGNEGPLVDHTKPRGEPGFDNMGSMSATSPSEEPVASFSGDEDDAAFVKFLEDASNSSGNGSNESGFRSGGAVTDWSKIDLNHIYYDFDRSNVRQDASIELKKIAAILKSNPDLDLVIKGHTDNWGSEDYNQRLSESRCQAAFDYVESMGIDKTRLSFAGFSEIMPIATNNTPSGRSYNRRVEFEIHQGKKVLLRSSQ